MEGLQSNSNSLLLLSALVQSLGHELRTPLSVISNELFCLGARESQGEEVERAKLRCNEIVTLLKRIASEIPATLSFSKIAAGDLLAQIFPRFYSTGATEIQKALWLLVDISQLSRVFSYSLKMATLELNATKPKLALVDNFLLITLQLPCEARCRSPVGCFKSFTEFSIQRLRSSKREAIVADAILWGHGARLEIQSNKTALEISFHLPIAR